MRKVKCKSHTVFPGREICNRKVLLKTTVNATDFFKMPSHITFHNKDDLANQGHAINQRN